MAGRRRCRRYVASVTRLRPTTLALLAAVLYVPFTVFNLAGGEYLVFKGLGVTLELILLAFFILLNTDSIENATHKARQILFAIKGNNVFKQLFYAAFTRGIKLKKAIATGFKLRHELAIKRNTHVH